MPLGVWDLNRHSGYTIHLGFSWDLGGEHRNEKQGIHSVSPSRQKRAHCDLGIELPSWKMDDIRASREERILGGGPSVSKGLEGKCSRCWENDLREEDGGEEFIRQWHVKLKVLKCRIIPHQRLTESANKHLFSKHMLLNVYCVCNTVPNVGIIHETPRQTKCWNFSQPSSLVNSSSQTHFPIYSQLLVQWSDFFK